MTDNDEDEGVEQPAVNAVRRAVSELELSNTGEDGGETADLVREKREVLRDQLSVILHQRSLAFTMLKMNIAVLTLVLVFLSSVLFLRRENVADSVSSISGAASISTADMFFVAIVLLVIAFFHYLLVYSHRFMMDSLEILRSDDRIVTDTTRYDSETEPVTADDVLENQSRLIQSNADSIEQSQPRIEAFVENSINLVLSVAVTLSAVIFLGIVSQLVFAPGLLVGAVAILVAASGIPFTKFALDHYL